MFGPQPVQPPDNGLPAMVKTLNAAAGACNRADVPSPKEAYTLLSQIFIEYRDLVDWYHAIALTEADEPTDLRMIQESVAAARQQLVKKIAEWPLPKEPHELQDGVFRSSREILIRDSEEMGKDLSELIPLDREGAAQLIIDEFLKEFPDAGKE